MQIVSKLVFLSALLLTAITTHADTPIAAATVTCMDGAASKGGKGACSGHGGINKEAAAIPAGATARCKDGSYYSLKEHKGACAKHGGVADWLDK